MDNSLKIHDHFKYIIKNINISTYEEQNKKNVYKL